MEHITTREELQKVLEENDKVIVDFFATWCGPCKMLSPILEQIDKENDDVLVVKVDTDQAEELAHDFKIMSIPTVAYFKNKQNVAIEVGYRGKQDILANIDKYLR